ncbi:MAG: M48 family metalloprotease, partial [Pseudomonadota bacterium]
MQRHLRIGKNAANPMMIARLATLSLVALVVAACQTNTATGRDQLLFMSAEQEQKIGDQEHPKLVKAFGGEFDNNALDQYVTAVGKTLDVYAETENVVYTYTVLDSEIANAFALPGGYVHISRGLLALMNNEAELASVLAHEVGHITGRHSAERYSRGTLAQVGVLAAAVLTGSQQVAQAAGTGAQLYLASYSRGQESESDRLGLRYMNKAGYNPVAMGTMLGQLGRNSTTLAKVAGREASQQFDMLSTHPQTPQRIRDADAAAAALEPKGDILRRDTFLSKIDGIPFGPGRAAGAIRGQRYGNLDDNIFWQAPSGYKLTAGSSNSVRAQGPNGTSVLYD